MNNRIHAVKRVLPVAKMAKSKNTKSIEEKPVKINKWDGAACKNSLDDSAKKVFLDKYSCIESHGLMDGRLLICTISVAFALFALVWDYFNPFPESRPILIICVLSYFFMMGILTLYTTFKEKGTFLIALEKDPAGIDPDNVWTMASQLKQYDDKYTVQLFYTDGTTKQSRSAQFTKSISCFFDDNGYLCSDIFEPEVIRLRDGLTVDKKDK